MSRMSMAEEEMDELRKEQEKLRQVKLTEEEMAMTGNVRHTEASLK